MKKNYNKISLKSRIINYLLKFTNSKEIFSSEDKTKKYIEKISKKIDRYNLPVKLGMKLEEFSYKVYSYNEKNILLEG